MDLLGHQHRSVGREHPARALPQARVASIRILGLVLFPVAVLLVLWGAIHPGERFLHERFGALYDDYTGRWP
jgi:protein-S-isoprenylcysteine O-methyltransferase Ste14